MVLTVLALAVPLPALALEGETEDPGQEATAPAALAVSTSLGSCGVGDTQVFCTLNVSFSPIEGATAYTATITRADGSVVDYGAISAGGTALSVPYVGPGSYSVRISAYGSPPEEEVETDEDEDGDKKGELIISEEAGASPGEDDPRTAPPGNAGATIGPGQDGTGSGNSNATETDSPGADEAPPTTPPATEQAPPACEETVTTPPPVQLPPLPEPPPPDFDPNNPDEDADGILDADEQAAYDKALAELEAAEAAAAAQPPVGVECPPAP